MKPTNNVGYLLNHLAFVLGRQSDQALQERLGLGFSQFKILTALKWNPSVRQKQIASDLGQTEASISRQIKLLQAKGLLSTRIKPDNKREHITALTGKGERLAETAMQILNSRHSPAFAILTSAQQQNLLEILNTMHGAVCAGKQSEFHYL